MEKERILSEYEDGFVGFMNFRVTWRPWKNSFTPACQMIVFHSKNHFLWIGNSILWCIMIFLSFMIYIYFFVFLKTGMEGCFKIMFMKLGF